VHFTLPSHLNLIDRKLEPAKKSGGFLERSKCVWMARLSCPCSCNGLRLLNHGRRTTIVGDWVCSFGCTVVGTCNWNY